MRFSYLSALAAAVMVNLIVAFPAADNDAPIPGYGIETLSWSVEVSPGQTHILNGTIQEVVAQAVEINPSYKLSSAKRAVDTSAIEARSLTKRNIICGNWPLADKGRILEGINYLNHLPASDRPTNGPGPGNCGRVSCSYNSAIWWCNDNTTPKTIDGWEWIANSAQATVNNCASAANKVSGQNFEQGNWNTIVRGNNC